MKKKMLIDATHAEETRVVMLDSNNKVTDFDLESFSRRQLKGNIYLAKVTRVEPSLQAAFVNYGGNRHGFLPFAEIHPDYYRIPVADRERLLAEQEELRSQIRARRQAEAEADEAEDENAQPAIESQPESGNSPFPSVEILDDDNKDDIITLDNTIIQSAETNTPAEPQQAFEHDDTLNPVSAFNPDHDSETAELGEPFDATKDDVSDDAANGETNELNAESNDPDNKQKRQFRGGRNRFRRRGGRREAALDQKLDKIVDKSDDQHDSDDDMQPLWKRIRRAYKIQEVIKRGQVMLIQVVKEERGNKGAAVTSYITMPGRYCVLMPNSPDSGGVSRKIGTLKDRKRMRKVLDSMNVPDGMSVILRTAGVEREEDEIRRDLNYLMRNWDHVRDTTLQSSAPALINEEGSLIKRAIRDLYSSDVEEVLVAGQEAYNTARDLMEFTMPDHTDRVKLYSEQIPLFVSHAVEPQLDAIHSNTVQLKSGGTMVINPTEALVSIDVNSGRATRERHIEETALKTNLEAADEVARQLRLRDLGGLVVIDFIDMENRRNNAQVERRLRDALSQDRARIQMGRISNFGLLEMSRQRLRPSLTETHFETCPHCKGLGIVRTVEAKALAVLRALEVVGIEGRANEVTITLPDEIMLFILNNKRLHLNGLEERYDLTTFFKIGQVLDDDAGFKLDAKSRKNDGDTSAQDLEDNDDSDDADSANRQPPQRDRKPRQSNRDNPRRQRNEQNGSPEPVTAPTTPDEANAEEGPGQLRNRGRRGGRGRNRFRDKNEQGNNQTTSTQNDSAVIQMPDMQPSTPAPRPITEVERQPKASVSYEVQTENTGEKKEGWWKRLIQ